MPVTLKELATQCGMSVSTVSKALNGYPDIREETRDLIRQAAAKVGLEWIAMQDADQGGEVNAETERVMAAVRKPAESR